MLTAIDAKLVAYRSKCHFEIVERKISDSAKKGLLTCVINMNEIPESTHEMFLEFSYILYELGYQTTINETELFVYWNVQKPSFYNILGDIEDDDWLS